MLDSLSKTFELNESIISRTTTNDSTIVLFTEMILPKGMVNLYKGAQNYIGKELPFNVVKSLEGNLINIKENNGKPTFVNLWFTSCPPCIKEMPELNEMQKKYIDKVNFISVTFEKKEKVEKFLQKNKFSFTHAVDAREQIDMIGTSAYPISFFIGKDNIVYYAFGNDPGGNYFENILKKLL